MDDDEYISTLPVLDERGYEILCDQEGNALLDDDGEPIIGGHGDQSPPLGPRVNPGKPAIFVLIRVQPLCPCVRPAPNIQPAPHCRPRP